MEAALIWQHASREADQSIAAHLNTQLKALDPAKKKLKGKKKGSKATKSGAMRISNSGHAEVQPGIDSTAEPTGDKGRDDRDEDDGAAGALVVVG